MTHHLDPDRRRPAPPHPGFDNRELDVDMDVCRWCSALVPADERSRTKHEEWDRRIVGRFLELFDLIPVPAHEHGRAGRHQGAQDPPTPSTGDQPQNGVEGQTQDRRPAGPPPADGSPSVPPESSVPRPPGHVRSSGGTTRPTGSDANGTHADRAARGRQPTKPREPDGAAPGRATRPANVTTRHRRDPEEIAQARWDMEHADTRRFTQ